MPRILYIECSPRKERSRSIQVARAFIEAYELKNPDHTIDKLDLWQTELPRFDNEIINTKYAIFHGEEPTAEQAAAWEAVEDIIEDFKSADKYLFSLPMWNFSIPYILKHYIDIITQPGYTFVPTESGYKGLLPCKPVVCIYARGGAYAPHTGAKGFDFQSRYLEHVLKFIGLKDVQHIFIEPTLGGSPEDQKAVMDKALEEARWQAERFY